MKGPGGRQRFDIRRVWECPQCHRRELTTGDVVTRICAGCAKTDPARQAWMRLVADMPDRPARPLASPPAVECPVDNTPAPATDGDAAQSVD